MARKSIIILTAICIFSLFCGAYVFAADDNSINLGNKISETMDKAGRSIENVRNDIFSDNLVNNAERAIDNGAMHIENGINNVENSVVNTTGMNRTMSNNRNSNYYNVTRTETTTDLPNAYMSGMSDTTWMWLVLAAAAIVIIVAVWYYATQDNERS